MEPTDIDEFIKYKLQGFEYHYFCNNYRLNDEIKEELFNRKYSHPDYIHTFFDHNDYTEKFWKSIDNRINDKNNIVIVVYGEPHLGKSEGAQSIAFYIKEAFKNFLMRNIKVHLSFSTTSFDQKIKVMKEGDVLIRDETPDPSGTGSVNIQKSLNNILKQVREHQNCFIFVSPDRVEAPVVTYYLECAGKNKGTRTSRFLIYSKEFKDGRIPFGRVFIELHKDEKFRKRYQEKKHKNIQLSKERGGGDYYEIDGDKLDRDIKELYDWCHERRVNTYRQIEAQLSNYNINKKREKKEIEMITGDDNYKKKLITFVYDKINHPSVDEVVEESTKTNLFDELDLLNKFKTFVVDYDNIYEEVKSEEKGTTLERDIEIYKLRRGGLIYDEIGRIYDLSSTGARLCYERTNSMIGYRKGKRFEKWMYNRLQESGIYDKLELIGDVGKSDLIGYTKKHNEKHILSLKCWSVKVPFKVDKKDMLPEIQEANLSIKKDFSKVLLYLIVFSELEDTIYIQDIDYSNPRESYYFRKLTSS